MKKTTDKNFWIILAISITSLILLIVGVIFLTKESAKKFYSAGYIINSSLTKTEKYYFNDNTVYKENAFEKYVFKDADNKEVSTSKDNFIHYLDNSLSFMKNGVILDLNNLTTSLVPYYNITDKSIIKYNGGQYYIEASDKTLIFNNFLGRITDNKYIVVGSDIRVKLSGNDDLVKADYFEILFIEDGIVKIENQEGSYQTVATDSTIYVGEDIKIDLGKKSVLYKDENKLSLSEMTINGNENIDIKPDEGKVDTDKNGTGNDTDTDNNPNNQNPDNNPNNNVGTDGEDGQGSTSVIKKEVSVDLIEAKVGMSDISVTFQVIDTGTFINGDLILTLKNMDTGKIEYRYLANVSELQTKNISSLSPNCNYVMTISDSSNVQYFQKTFRTESLDLKLVRKMVTTDSLMYSLVFGEHSEVKSANVTLYQNDEVLKTYTITNGEDNNIEFTELTSNTNYIIKVDSVVFNNTNYASTYMIEANDMTLKKKPAAGTVSVKTNNDGKEFIVSAKDFIDEENSIIKYTYQIYKADNLENGNPLTKEDLVYEYSSTNLNDITLRTGENGIEDNQNYVCKVVAEYYDNYKYGEVETHHSDYFIMLGKPVLEFTSTNIDFNLIEGIISIKDESCTLPLNGRECKNGNNTFTLRYAEGNSSQYNKLNIKFTVDEENPNILKSNLSLDGLKEDTSYIFEVYGTVDLNDDEGSKENSYIGSFAVKTKGIDALRMENWKQNSSNFDTPISVNTSMVPTNPESNYGDKISSIKFNLYKGDALNGLSQTPLITFKDTEDIRNKYYNKDFTITSNMLGINNLDELRELSGGKLSRYYTLEVTDAYDTTETNKFTILNNKFVFETPAILLLEDELADPTIEVTPITNETAPNYGKEVDKKLGNSTIVGYQVIAAFDKTKIESYFQGNNPVLKLNFYASNTSGKVISTNEIDLTEDNTYETYFFLDYGTEHNVADKDLRRGNSYIFSYDISIDTNNDGEEDTKYPSRKPASEEMTSTKEDPKFYMYVDNSTNTTITYKYKIIDYDNALYKEGEEYNFYYTVTNSEEEYLTPIIKDGNLNTLTLSNLSNSTIYIIKYNRASTKIAPSSKVTLGSYFFDGYYNGEDYNIGYRLEYGNFDNRLKIILDDNKFLNRVSSYLVTVSSQSDKYQTVVSNLSTCDESKCIIIDYADIESFKGKDSLVALEAFYDTGYIGFSQPSKLDKYFESLGLVTKENSSQVGYVYQTTNTTIPGSYFYIDEKGAYQNSPLPRGILGFELKTPILPKYLTTVNLLDIKNKTFVEYGAIIKKDANVIFSNQNGITEVSPSASKHTFNPKVLDKMTIQTEDNTFKFTSITPKVTSTTASLINGANMNIYLSVSAETLETDFVKTDGKYKFYVDIYSTPECTEETLVKTVEVFYEDLENISFGGLTPDTTYYYKISADMNKNNTKVKTPLFDYNKAGYIEYVNTFKTLGKDDVFKTVYFNYKSSISEDKTIYSERLLNITANLKTSTNLNIKFELYDNSDKLEYEYLVENSNITGKNNSFSAKYTEDITGKDFVFGNNYHTLKIIAITTDLGLELELYNSKLNTTSSDNIIDIAELVNPIFTVKPEAVINTDEKGNYIYGIDYTIDINDEDKVINDGIYYIELQDAAYNNACKGHESDCIRQIDIKKQGINIKESFTNLEPDTNYVIYIYANTYRNNISLEEKDGLVYVRKGQYTKNELNFSLGAVTPTAVAKNKLVITFAGATNLESTLKELDYNIAVQGGEKVASGTLKIGENINFKKDSDGYPTLEITMPEGKELGLNNYILITYRILDKNNNLTELVINGKTNHQYTVKSTIK